ncbi:uncharacterized protein [Asterias amurensis]|uniref:uncharacterized protein isoform X2 n=1 Tax=Asterias amurensis TaxID=7602 RepID=UPI003AB77BFB
MMNSQQSSPRPQAVSMATTPPSTATLSPANLNPPILVEQPKNLMMSPSPSASSPVILPPVVPPPAHQRLSLPQLTSALTSANLSPNSGLGPPTLSPSHHPHHSPSAVFPSGSSPVSASPIPMTVTSPIGKHGGCLGALTASVNALQRPASTSGHYLVQHSPKSPPSTALVSGVPVGIRHLRPVLKTSVGGKSDQAVIITTQTPIFNRSHHSQTTTTMVNLPGTSPMSTLVRVTPSMQQAIHNAQPRPLIIQPRMMGGLGLITTADVPLIRGVTSTMVNNPTLINPYNVPQSKLHSALTGFSDGSPPRIHLPPSPHGPLSLVAQVQPQGKCTSFTMHPSKSIPHANVTLHPQMRHIAPAKAPISHVPLQPKRPPPYPTGAGSPISHHPLSPGASYAMKHNISKMKNPSPATKPGSQVKPIKPVQQQGQRSEVKMVKPVQREKKSPLIPVAVPPLVVPTAPVRPDVTSTVEPQQQTKAPAGQSELVTLQPRAEVVGVTEGVARVERQIPKAVVKPQVLTHVIDGFIIEESKEPFSIGPSSLWSDEYPQLDPRLQQSQMSSRRDDGRQQDGMQSLKRSAPDNQEMSDGMPLRCEFCGKVDRPHKFKRSKRFCSLACSKRYNVGCSKRLGLFAPQRENHERIKHKMKLQVKAKPLKGSRGKHGRLSFNVDRPWCTGQSFGHFPQGERMYSQDQQQQGSSSMSTTSAAMSNPTAATNQDRESNSSSAGPSEESSSLESSMTFSPSPNSEVDETPPVSDDAFDDPAGPEGDPAKWSVQDVYDFIHTLPGCSDYADEFLRQEIDGQALMLLKEDHLMTAMNMKLGPALKIISRIYSLKEKI